MARATYKGVLKVGLVTCPVGVIKAAKEERVSLHWIHKECGAKVRLQKICTACGKEVTNPGKGFEIEKGHIVEVDEKEIEALKMESEKIVHVKSFVSIKEIPAVAYKGKLQYLGQTKGYEDVYSLLVEVLAKKKLVGIAQVTVRGRDYPVALLSVDGMLMLDELYTFEETGGRAPVVAKVKVDKEMKELGEALISGMTERFHHGGIKSEYEVSVRKVIEEAVQGKPKRAGKTEKKEVKKSSSMEQLRASLSAI